MSTPDDDDDDKQSKWLHPGDLGTILLAGVFLVGMLSAVFFMLSSPEPFKGMFAKAPANQPSEVTVTVPPKQ